MSTPTTKEAPLDSPRLESRYIPEIVDQGTREAFNYLLHFKDDFLRVSDFADFKILFDVYDHLDKKTLLIKPRLGQSIIRALIPLAANSAHERYDPKDILTHEAIAFARSFKQGENYFPETLLASPEDPGSLSRNGGVYDYYIPIDQESTTNGGEELQQGLAAIGLHSHQALSITANTHLSRELCTTPNTNGTDIVQNSKNILEKSAKSGFESQQQPHLAHITKPIQSKNIRYPRNTNLYVHQGEFLYRSKEDKVRLLRGSQDGQTVYYLDMDPEEVKLMDSKLLGDILLSIDQDTSQLDFDKEWSSTKDGFSLGHDEKNPPRFSISSGIHTRQLQEAMKAINGSSAYHLSYDFGILILQTSHVTENAASLKDGLWDVARAVQFDRQPGQELAPHTLPWVEERSAYHANGSLPPNFELLDLLRDLKSARKDGKSIEDFYDNKVLLSIFRYFHLENIRQRFPTIHHSKLRIAKQKLEGIEQYHRIPLLKELAKFVAEHQSEQVPLSERGRAALEQFIAPEFKLDDYLPAHLSTIFGPVANNMLNRFKELSHNSFPIPDQTKTGKFVFNTKGWLKKYNLDKTFAAFGVNIYNIYKLLTSSWRKKKRIGAEALGKLFSPKLAKFMQIWFQVSGTGTDTRTIDGKELYTLRFETADPPIEEEGANALGHLITKEEDFYRLTPSFRDKLLPNLVELLPLQHQDFMKHQIKFVASQLNRLSSQEDADAVTKLALDLQGEWISNYQRLSPHTNPKVIPPSKSIALLETIISHHTDLTRGPQKDLLYRAFQVFLTAAQRGEREQLLAELQK